MFDSAHDFEIDSPNLKRPQDRCTRSRSTNGLLRLPRLDQNIPDKISILKDDPQMRAVAAILFEANIFRASDIKNATSAREAVSQGFRSWLTRQTMGLKVFDINVSIGTAKEEDIPIEYDDDRSWLCMVVRGAGEGVCRALLPRAELFRRVHDDFYPTAMDALVRLSWVGAPIASPAERYDRYLLDNFDGCEDLTYQEVVDCLEERYGEVEDVSIYMPSYRKRLMGGDDCVKMKSSLTPTDLRSLHVHPHSLAKRLANLTAHALEHIRSLPRNLHLLSKPESVGREVSDLACHLIYRPHSYEQEMVDDWWEQLMNSGCDTDMWRWSELPEDPNLLIPVIKQWQAYFKSIRLIDAMLDVISVDSWFN